jgi:PPM family protein phosphatase
MSLSVEVAGKSDIGCVRTNNEDNFGYDTRYGIFVVCDGMGGQQAGEVASKIGVDTILEYFRKANGKFFQFGDAIENFSPRANALASAIRLANQKVIEAAAQSTSKKGMGSTVVSTLVVGKFYSVAHVGDSRIYLIHGNEIKPLTSDHSLVMEQVKRGLMTMDEAETSHIQNIIIRALGAEDTVQPDVDDHIARPGDMILMASDGLTKHVKDSKLLEVVLKAAPSLDGAVDGLIQTAKDHGGDDNITALMIRFVEVPWYKRWFGKKGSSKWQNSI